MVAQHEIFVDTGAWLALIDSSDHFHQQAKSVYGIVLQTSKHLVTTNLVVAETYNLVQRRVSRTSAVQFLTVLRSSARLERVYSDRLVEIEAENLLKHYHDQDFSFVDAVSFTVMRQRQIEEAFAFDRHFIVAGFALLPGA